MIGGIDGYLEIFEHHKADVKELFGDFPEYKSFGNIIRMEYERWFKTDEVQKGKLDKLLKKNKNTLTLNDWIVCVTSWGIPADQVAQFSGIAVPGNLYNEIAYRQEQQAKATEVILYNTAHL